MKKYIPFVLTDILACRRVIWLFEMILWPMISLVSFGIFTIFIKASPAIKTLLFTGIIGWSTINLAQTAISRGFMHEIWDKSIRQTFATPIKLTDFIFGHWMYGILEIFVAFMLMSIVALNFFGLNLFSLSFYMILTLGLIALSGLIIGTIAISFILLLGLRVDFLVWTIVDMIVFISGVYYSVTVFPPLIQTISHLFPVIYVFEGMREVLATGTAIGTYMNGYFIAFIWVMVVLFLGKRVENYARRKGFYQKYG